MNGSIEIRHENIPVKPSELRKFILIGRQMITAHKAKLKAISQVGIAAAAHKAALQDAQTIAEVVLDAESRLGEIIMKIPNKKASSGGGTRSLPNGIDKKMSHEAQQIHKHPEVVEQCKADARQKGEIVTSRQVLNGIQKELTDSPERKRPGAKPKHYYLTQPRLSFLRDKTAYILELLDVRTNSLCPVSLVRAELHKIQEELKKLHPYHK